MTIREQWLVGAREHLAQKFFNKPVRRLPKLVAVSCGIPAGSARAIGQCWDATRSKDGTTHIFICPSQEQPVEVLGVLLHELCHAVVGVQEKHNKVFGQLARAVGLEGKLTATVPGEACRIQLEAIAEQLGPYPHSALDKLTKKIKKQRPKRLEFICLDQPDYRVWVEEAIVEEFGPPLDPFTSQPMRPKKEPKDDD